MKDSEFLQARDVLARYGVSRSLLNETLARPDSDFPRPFRIGRLRVWRLADLVRWEDAQAAAASRQKRAA